MVKGKKLIAMILVFTLTFSNFAFVTESIAATGFVSLFGNKSDENVEFEALLKSSDQSSSTLVSDVNNEDLAIELKLDVKDSGYLKDGKVEIKAEEEQELNFVIKENNKVAEQADVQSLEDNVITLNKIDNSEEKLDISIPIEYEMEDYINENKLANTAKVVFTGIYVDDEGKENEISKEVELTLAWKDDRSVSVSNEVSKYIQFGSNGVILQTIVKVDSSNENKKTLPAKSSELNIDIPQLNNTLPQEIDVIANSTAGTNGKGVGETEFSENNWSYNQEENKISINIENQKQLVDVTSEEYLKVEGEEKKQEERYYSKGGVDEYVITYTYKNIALLDEMNITTKSEAKFTTFSGVQSENNSNVITSEKTDNYTLTGQTGNLVSYNIENETKEVSKIYAYTNQEKEYNSKTAINISYKDIVEGIIVQDTENYYVDKSENKIEADDIYYKQVSINKENFNEILGEDGTVIVADTNGNVLVTFNKEYNPDENGNLIYNFQDRVSKVVIQTSAPVNNGNLIVSNIKAVSNISITKPEYASAEYLATSSEQFAKFSYVSELTNVGNNTVKTKLNDTVTDINFVMDRDSLSTVTTNSNVEMRIELNNDKETSDIYGNSIFEIEMPSYITSMNVTSASMIYGEGLELSGAETYTRDGKIIIKLTVSGSQTTLNSGVLTNGSNIVINADIDVDSYTPSIEDCIKAYCYNSEATNYSNAVEYTIENSPIAEYEEVKFEYGAPSGVVAINSIEGYDELGSSLTSIKQGEQIDYIDIYSEAKTSTMDIVVMNNNENEVTDVAILGRIPFEGVKDISTGKDLGTTLDTALINEIVSDEANNAEFTIYYSENKEATKDLSDSSNGWTATPSNLENIKSYLIVPTDSNYKMAAKQVLKFSYQYRIPADLDHNEKIYGTFLAYFTDVGAENADETAKPDLVGLTTGAGPELGLEIKSNKSEVKALEEFTITTTVSNIGEDIARDVVATIPVPENVTFVSAEASRDTISTSYQDGSVIATDSGLAKGDSFDVTLNVKANEIEEYESNEVNVTSKVSATDLQKELTANADEVSIKRSELAIEQFMHDTEPDGIKKKDDVLNFVIMPENLTDSTKTNVKVVTQLPKELSFSEAYMSDENGKTENANYDSGSNKVTWTIDKIDSNNSKTLQLFVKVGDLDTGVTEEAVKISSQVSADGTDTYNAEELNVNLGKGSLSVVQTSSTPTYVSEEDTINYVFSIKNEGASFVNDVVLTDIVPDKLKVTAISYSVDGEETINEMSETENAKLTLNVPANSVVDVNVQATSTDLESDEVTVTNEGIITTKSGEEIKSNSVTHIVKATESDESETSTNDTETGESAGDITKSYKIEGTAWIDSNKNGMRDSEETRMSDVTAMLVNSDNGTIKGTTKTNSNGEYTFTGLSNGNYLVLFKYDTRTYTTTTYKQEGVETSLNSDVVTTKIEQDGKKENGAVTDVISINGASVSGIDIGLVESDKFSLQLDKSISKVTVQNSQGTKTEEFDKAKLAKYDIAAKYLSGTTVYVEYTLTVTNNGDLSGYASEIVDYIPQGMTFNSNLNADWYTGPDGSLYTKALANNELAVGESKEIKLVLTKQMTAENTGLVSNTAEIADDFNIYGVSDNNSTPSNKAQGEDDMSTADTILTVKTGESLIYLSGIITALIVGGIVGFVVYERVLKNKRKGGV